MLLKFSTLILCLSFFVFSEATKIYYKPFTLGEQSASAQANVLLEYNFIPESSSFMISNRDLSFVDGKYCLSLDSNAEDCFQIADLKHDQDYDLVINGKNTKKVSLKNIQNENGSFNISAVVSSSLEMPKTPLDLLKKTTKKYEDLKKNKKQASRNNIKNNIAKPVHEELENVEKEEEEPSFMAKNWRYLIVGFLIYKLVSGGKTATKETKKD